jgi:hypothetical protein
MRVAIGFSVAGFVLLVAGCAMAWRPLGLMVAGGLLLAAAMKQRKQT